MTPRIAITCWRRPLATFLSPATDLYTLGAEYVDAIRACGAIPLLVPHLEPGDVDMVLDAVDGLVLSGGGDIDPATYGAVDAGVSVDVDARADRSELALIRAGEARRTPTLAICRGMQMMNVAFGGTLLQDCRTAAHGPVSKVPDEVMAAEHAVRFEPGSRLAAIYGTDRRNVNTIHHQVLDRVADGLAVTARAPDGVVEGVEATSGWEAIGVQWHPEKGRTGDDAPLFAAFVERVRRTPALK